jgi:hypothetical protein
MKGRLLLDVVVRQGSAVFKLFSSEDQALLIRGNPLLLLDLAFDVVNSIRGFDLQRDTLATASGQTMRSRLCWWVW